jgi:hypothetical protein
MSRHRLEGLLAVAAPAMIVEILLVDDGSYQCAPADVKKLFDALEPARRSQIVDLLVAEVEGRLVERLRQSFVVSALVATDPEFASRIGIRPDLPEIDELIEEVSYAYNADLQLVALLTATGREAPPLVVAALRRLDPQLLDEHPGLLASAPVINPGEAWSDAALADLATLPPVWMEVMAHAGTATATRPNRQWLQTGRRLLAEAGAAAFVERVSGWLRLVGRQRTVVLTEGEYSTVPLNELPDPYNVPFLRGLVWLLGLTDGGPVAVRALGDLVEVSLRKVAGVGPRNVKLANTAVQTLATLDGGPALAQLARLSSRVSFKGTLKEVTKALDARAAALNLTRDEVEELAVPSYGLTEVGRRVDKLGSAVAELTVDGRAATLAWRNAAGKAVKSPPAEVRQDHAEELAELKAVVKDIEKMLTAQRERLDRQLLARRVWPVAAWRERYLDHPLVGVLGRALLWTVGGQPLGYAEGSLRDLADTVVEPAPDATVELWHPIGRPVEEVLAAREWLERHGIRQPFKQAHREVYVLTPAEEATRTYSNRFAGHILRQHQVNTLAASRGWTAKLRLMVDDDFPPLTRELPQWGVRAEYWVEGAGDDYGVDTLESGAYRWLTTDQVRFYPLTAAGNVAHAGGGGYGQAWHGSGPAPDPMPLAEVPPLVFGEIMRDVDLFVGVGSVGNDPTWSDGGPDGRYQHYWESYSFGDLSATAQTRKDLLNRLLPRLRIGPRSRIDGRFLVVTGSLHEYKIHLGSGNILMSPDDRYLCIVADRGGAARAGLPLLPFDGDATLSLILSKAIMLADDTAITDPTIRQQIGHEDPALAG